MKKWFLLVLTILTIPLVEALTIFGSEVSLLVILPLVLILIVLIIFIMVIVRDKIKERSAIKASNLQDIPDVDLAKPPLLAEPPSIAEPPAKEEPEKPTEKPKLTLKTKEKNQTEEQAKPAVNYLEKIGDLERKINQMSIEDARKELISLITDFFSYYAKINYKFTFEELENELKKRNKDIVFFPRNLSLITYSPKKITTADLIELMNEFKEIVASALEKTSPEIPEFKKENMEKENELYKLIKKGTSLIKKDITAAAKKYDKIYHLYTKLSEEEKGHIKPSIMGFYNKLIKGIS